MDNVFVFLLIFQYFNIPLKHQYKILFWGILGAIVMRLIMIILGVVLIERFEFLFYIFGGFLMYSAVKIYRTTQHSADGALARGFLQFLKQRIRVVETLYGGKFFVKLKGLWYATPMFVVLLMVEKADLIFALDSIPAIIAITQDPYIVYTSNIFAILGLRSLYFVIFHMVNKFKYLRHALAIILGFIGIKMLLIPWELHVPTVISLGVIITVLLLSILFSVRDNMLKR